MKKTRVLRIRNPEPTSQTSIEAIQQVEAVEVGLPEVEENISKESERILPTRVRGDGFISMTRKIRPTREGMESEVETPLIIMESGHRVAENQIKGQCDICSGFDSFLFNCHVYGCKKSLCLKDVFLFEYGDKKTPYCLEHYRRTMDEFDTWQDEKKGK